MPTTTIADALRAIATQLDELDQLMPPADEFWASLHIQPPQPHTAREAADLVDLVARQLFGQPGMSRLMYDGSTHHHADGRYGPVRIGVYCETLPPDPNRAALHSPSVPYPAGVHVEVTP